MKFAGYVFLLLQNHNHHDKMNLAAIFTVTDEKPMSTETFNTPQLINTVDCATSSSDHHKQMATLQLHHQHCQKSIIVHIRTQF